MSDGKSSALAIVATLGLKPCWSACFQNVTKSGGSGTPVTIWAFAFLKAARVAREVVVGLRVEARVDQLVAGLLERGGKPVFLSAQRSAVRIVRVEGADGLVRRHLCPHVHEDGDDVLEPPEEVVGPLERLRRIALASEEPCLPRTSVTMHGIPFASHTSETGFVVSGVLLTSIRSMLSSRIRLCATVAPRFAFDCESRSRISIGYVFLPDPEALAEQLLHHVDGVLVRRAEAGERTGQRCDPADLDRPCRSVRPRGRHVRGKPECGGTDGRALEQQATVEAAPHRSSSRPGDFGTSDISSPSP